MNSKISVISHPSFLSKPLTELPDGLTGVYQLGSVCQLGPDSAAMFLNIRQTNAGSNDVEIGTDLAVFSSPDLRKIDSIMPVSRTHVKHREGIGLVRVLSYPLHGAFVPIGSGLPHEGTGFAIATSLDRPCKTSGAVSGDTSTVKTLPYFTIYQFETDGKTVRITDCREVQAKDFLPDWHASGLGLGLPIPDVNGFIDSISAMRPGQTPRDAVSGMLRWSYGPDGWHPSSFTPIAPVISTEPSIVRAKDNSLVFTMRVAQHFQAEGNPAIEAEISKQTTARIWRSTDNGETWSLALEIPNVLGGTPRSLCTSLSGSVYLLGNGITKIDPANEWTYDTRCELRIWPIRDDFSGIEDSLPLKQPQLNPGSELSPDKCWYVDHPFGRVCILADGKAHTLLSYRMLSAGEIFGQHEATPYTGTYLEEMIEE